MKFFLLISSLCFTFFTSANFKNHIKCFKSIRSHHYVEPAHGVPKTFELMAGGQYVDLLAFPGFKSGQRGFIIYTADNGQSYFVPHFTDQQSLNNGRKLASKNNNENSFRYSVKIPGKTGSFDFFVKTNFSRRIASRMPASQRANSGKLNKVEGYSIRLNSAQNPSAYQATPLTNGNAKLLLEDYLISAISNTNKAYKNEKSVIKYSGQSLARVKREFLKGLNVCARLSNSELKSKVAEQKKYIK